MNIKDSQEGRKERTSRYQAPAVCQAGPRAQCTRSCDPIHSQGDKGSKSLRSLPDLTHWDSSVSSEWPGNPCPFQFCGVEGQPGAACGVRGEEQGSADGSVSGLMLGMPTQGLSLPLGVLSHHSQRGRLLFDLVPPLFRVGLHSAHTGCVCVCGGCQQQAEALTNCRPPGKPK